MLHRLMRYDNMLYIAIVLLYVSYFIPLTPTIPVVFLLLLYLYHNHFNIHFKVSGYIVYFVTFILFCYASCIWAVDASKVLEYTNRILRIMIDTLVLYLCVQDEKSSDILFKPMILGGYIVIAYSVSFFGISQLRQILSGTNMRISNDFINVNILGMCAAFTCIMHVYYAVLNEKWNISHILLVPATLFLAVTGSRKGFLVLFVGITGIIIWNNVRKGKTLHTFLRIFFAFSVCAVILYLLSNLAAFSNIRERMMHMIAMVVGEGNVDNSLMARSTFAHIGLNVFKEHPVLGVGINNARLFNYRDVYLHNNYVELLADGGIIGFVLYYSLYIVLLIRLWKTKNKAINNAGICLIILIATLIIHYGHVAFRMGYEYYLLLAIYLEMRLDRNMEEEITSSRLVEGRHNE